MSQETKKSYADAFRYIIPMDDNEEAELSEIINWVESDSKLVKKDNPAQHLGAVAFITTVDEDKVYLINHRKAGAKLMPGGHVDEGDTLQQTIEKELAEELGLEVDMSESMPFYASKVLTQGSNGGHYDVTAVFKVVVEPSHEFIVQEKEAEGGLWVSRDVLSAMPGFTLLPAIHQKLSVGKQIMLDNGGVLSDHYCDPAHSMLAACLGVDQEVLKKLLSESSEHGAAYRTNKISREDFWGQVLSLAGVNEQHNYSKLEKLWAESYQINTTIVEILKRYKNVGLKIGLIANTDIYRKVYMQGINELSGLFDYVIASCDVGEIKPNKKIFEYAINLSGVKPQNIIYFDDRASHVEAALAAGMRSHAYRDVHSLREGIDIFYRGKL